MLENNNKKEKRMNLLLETIRILNFHKKNPKDVLWVGNKKAKTTWTKFAQIADTEYNDNYNAPQVAEDLLIVGCGFWLERCWYNGAEWWKYKEVPQAPENAIKLKALTVWQAVKLGISTSCKWESLFKLNDFTLNQDKPKNITYTIYTEEIQPVIRRVCGSEWSSKEEAEKAKKNFLPVFRSKYFIAPIGIDEKNK